MSVTLHHGDCLAVMATMPDCSVDAVVTDPPYDLTSGKKGGTGVRSLNLAHPAGRSRITTGGGFMGKKWDGTGVAFRPETWKAVQRVMKPGAFLLSMGGTRTEHRMTCAIEDAGFRIVDKIIWLHAQGFPKHKWQLKPAAEMIVVAQKPFRGSAEANVARWGVGGLNIEACRIGYSPADAEAVGRVNTPGSGRFKAGKFGAAGADGFAPGVAYDPSAGRWPANVLLSHAEGCTPVGVRRVKTLNGGPGKSKTPPSVYGGGWTPGAVVPYADADGFEHIEAFACVEGCPVAELDAQAGERKSGAFSFSGKRAMRNNPVFGKPNTTRHAPDNYGDAGGASRFFFVAKAATSERWGILSCECEASILNEWERPDQSQNERTECTSPRRAIFGGESADGCASPMSRNGSGTTDPFRPDINSTTETATSRTTTSPISNSSHQLSISECTTVPNSATANGGNPATSAASSSPRQKSTSISQSKATPSTGVVGPVTLLRSMLPYDCERCGAPLKVNSHPTQKPIKLMEHLCTLITPPGGTILDPFLGSGTTGCAAVRLGFDFIGIDMDEVYCDIASARIAYWTPKQQRLPMEVAS